ncbi:hypothetical protein [Oerskovia paurometabola]|uniref:hypothetical protein n=1 Tax=Oerskovia paurometabola TaxID=162170 RepID=UPI0037FE7414
MTMAALEALEAARATLRRAELRAGVRSSAPSVPNIEEAPRPLGAILEGGRLPVGTASVVQGSTSLLLALLALLAQSQRSTDWVAVVGAPSLGYLAAAQAGISLERLAVIPHAGEDPAGVVAALLDGMRYVVVGPAVALSASERRRLLARARERGTGLISTREWEQAAVRLDVDTHRWSGVDHGSSYLRRCELEVTRTLRGNTDRWTLTLPSPGSSLGPGQAGQARPRRSSEPAPLRLVV